MFSRKLIKFFYKKIQFLNVSSIFTILVAFKGNFAFFSDSKKIHECFPINPTLFFKKVKFWTFWEILFFKVHSTENFQLWLFYKNSRFFLKNSSSFFKKPNFWTFWEFSVFQSEITANLLLLGILKKSRFFEKHIFFQENRQNLAVFRTFTILVGFNSKLDNFRNFKSIEDCFSKIL